MDEVAKSLLKDLDHLVSTGASDHINLMGVEVAVADVAGAIADVVEAAAKGMNPDEVDPIWEEWIGGYAEAPEIASEWPELHKTVVAAYEWLSEACKKKG